MTVVSDSAEMRFDAWWKKKGFGGEPDPFLRELWQDAWQGGCQWFMRISSALADPELRLCLKVLAELINEEDAAHNSAALPASNDLILHAINDLARKVDALEAQTRGANARPSAIGQNA